MSSNQLDNIEQMLKLIMQKLQIPPDIGIWDDGYIYYVYLDDLPPGMPHDSLGRHIEFCGCIGECIQFIERDKFHLLKLCRADEYYKT